MAQQQESKQPVVHLLDAGDKMTLEDIIALFRSLTGRDPTPQELEDAKKEWEAS